MILRGRWCDIIVLNVQAPSEYKSDDTKDSSYVELECIFSQFPKYHMKILLEIRIKSSGIRYFDNGVRVINFVTLEIWLAKSAIFPHGNIHKYA
jgi:hypothetical protein